MMEKKNKVEIKINQYLAFMVFAISITILLSFTEILNINNFFTSDWLGYTMHWNGEHFRCGSTLGFTDFFTHKVDCISPVNAFGSGELLMGFLFNTLFVSFIYYGWFSKLNSKYHWIGVRFT